MIQIIGQPNLILDAAASHGDDYDSVSSYEEDPAIISDDEEEEDDDEVDCYNCDRDDNGSTADSESSPNNRSCGNSDDDETTASSSCCHQETNTTAPAAAAATSAATAAGTASSSAATNNASDNERVLLYPFWQRSANNHSEKRKIMIRVIARFLFSKRAIQSPVYYRRVVMVARKLEYELYTSSATEEEYSNPHTLPLRLRSLAARLCHNGDVLGLPQQPSQQIRSRLA